MLSKNDPMKAYMQDIGEIPLISKDEEIELAALIRQGDDAARQKLIKANLRLVVKIAHDFKGFGLPLLDLISEGNIGLMRAAEKFDPSKGAKFSSYSAWWIKQSMRRALSQKSRTIRVPVASAGKINKIRMARIQLTQQLGRPPTDEEIATQLDFTTRTVQGLRLADLKTFSLHDPIQKGEEGSFEDLIADTGASTPDEIIEGFENVQRLRGLLDNLDERERRILMMRYGLDGARPKTLEEVSRIIGRTRERVRQIQMQSLKKLKAMLDDDTLDNDGQRNPDADPEFDAAATIPAEEQPWKDPRRLGADKPLLFSSDAPLSVLNLSTRSLNSLRSAGIENVAQLASRTAAQLTEIRFFGEKCLHEVTRCLEAHNEDLQSL